MLRKPGDLPYPRLRPKRFVKTTLTTRDTLHGSRSNLEHSDPKVRMVPAPCGVSDKGASKGGYVRKKKHKWQLLFDSACNTWTITSIAESALEASPTYAEGVKASAHPFNPDPSRGPFLLLAVFRGSIALAFFAVSRAMVKCCFLCVVTNLLLLCLPSNIVECAASA